MKVNLLVNCQYYENYNVDANGWGEFTLETQRWVFLLDAC